MELKTYRDLKYSIFTDGTTKEVTGRGWKIFVKETGKGNKSFEVYVGDINSWFSFSKYGLKQAVKFIEDKLFGA